MVDYLRRQLKSSEARATFCLGLHFSEKQYPEAHTILVHDVEPFQNILGGSTIRAPALVQLSHWLWHPHFGVISKDLSCGTVELLRHAAVDVPQGLDELSAERDR